MKKGKKYLCAAASIVAFCYIPAVSVADEVAITFYNTKADNSGYNGYTEGFALVQDDRDIAFERGRMTVTLPGVSSAIDPATVTFNADEIKIIEQNFDLDLLTHGKLLEKSVGDTVEIVRVNPATGAEVQEKAKILSVNQGAVIEVGDKIEVLRDDNLPTRVIFDKVPDNLRASPTLSVQVDSEDASTRNARLTYISGGLSWRGDYVALFDEKASTLDLQGWATIKNLTETTFENASLSLTAGAVSLSSSSESWASRWQRRNNNRNRSRVRSGTEASDQERIGENYIYTLPGRTTVASNQTKQISLIEAQGVRAERVYEYHSDGFFTIEDPKNVDVRIAFSNSKAGGLSEPLPAGALRVYTRDSSGRAQFIGEDEIPNSPAGSDLSVRIGEAFDITVQPVAVYNGRPSRYHHQFKMKYTLRNAKSTTETVTIRQPSWWGWWRRWNETVTEESHPHRENLRGELVWDIEVPARDEAVLEFTLDYKY